MGLQATGPPIAVQERVYPSQALVRGCNPHQQRIQPPALSIHLVRTRKKSRNRTPRRRMVPEDCHILFPKFSRHYDSVLHHAIVLGQMAKEPSMTLAQIGAPEHCLLRDTLGL